MKKSIVTIAILVSVFLTGSVLIVSCNSKKDGKEEQKQAEGDHKMDSTVATYACPMHPEVVGKEGDECSKCGMKLEAMKNADSTATHDH